MKRAFWNPWHGCHKCSPGCLNCFVYYLDKKRNIDSSIVNKSKTNFNLPLKKDRYGNFKISSNTEVATCFTSDFFIEEADSYRMEAWKIIKERPDVNFLICTKRIERFYNCIPSDWNDGYPNVIIAVTCENQQKVLERLPILLSIKACKKYILASPLLEEIDLAPFLSSGKIDMVSVAGESYENARECNFDWIIKIKRDCLKYNVKFDFHQTGSNFVMNNKKYKIRHSREYSQARKAMKYLNSLK